MNVLETTFAGLSLRNPVIVSSCGRTASARNNLAFERAGAAAVVLKSLFEENIMRHAEHLTSDADHVEAADYMQAYLRDEMLREYIDLIKESKRLCTIPVIASINCYSAGEWCEFARLLEQAGADAIELNVMSIRTSREYSDGEFERQHVDILTAVRRAVKIPVIVKLGSNHANPVNLIDRLYAAGAAGVVLFNRMYQTDIDIERMEYCPGEVFTSQADLARSLQWTGIASAAVPQIDYALSGGVHDGKAVVKALLAGASAVEVCSAIYLNGEGWIEKALGEVEEWRKRHGFESVGEFKGRLNARDVEHADRLERTQFLKYFGEKK